MTGVKS